MKKLLLIIGAIGILACGVSAQETIFFDSFEDGVFDLTRWEPIPGPNDGVVTLISGIQGVAPDGFFHVFMGKNSDGAANTNELRLYLDLSSYDDVRLEYWCKYLEDETSPFDDLYFSDDSAKTWTEVLQLRPGEWQSDLWGMLPPIDVAGLAKDKGLRLTEDFVISFRQQGIADRFGSGSRRDGLRLDAVRVFDPQIQFVLLPFSESFEGFQPTLGPMWSWSNPSYPVPGTATADMIKPEGKVSIVPADQFGLAESADGFNALLMGRRGK